MSASPVKERVEGARLETQFASNAVCHFVQAKPGVEVMSNWVAACDADDIDEEDVMRFDHDGRSFAIYRSPGDSFFATVEIG